MDTDRAPKYTIKQAAKAIGVSDQSIRQWERDGSLPQPQRTPGKHRRYSEQDIQTIRDIIKGQ